MAAPKQTAKTKTAPAKGAAAKTPAAKAAALPASKAAALPAAKAATKNGAKNIAKNEVKSAAKTVAARPAPLSAAAKAAIRARSKVPDLPAVHAVVENLQPVVDGGRYPVKAVPGEVIEVTADIFRDGHEKCEAALLFRKEGEEKWKRAPMEFVDNDRWLGKFAAFETGNYEYTVEARTLGHSNAGEVPFADTPYRYEPAASLRVDSPLAEFSAWYEMWARSQGTDPFKSARFQDMADRLPEIRDMGFDVLYLPPIHPIGVTKRKGADNALVAQPGEPGCPYAIGNGHGGHKAVDPELGTLEECRGFFRTASDMGFTIALDFALNCSPDHPYVKAHPDWFYREKDGTIKCAENPPKKYEDVYPLNFFCQDRKALWKEIKSIVEFWMDMGVTIFRVDNPHTKPFAFWEWMIRELKAENPDLIFLSEAFTRPKVMKRLAKIGFDMSYTYFTWRTNAAELREYLEELAQGPAKQFMKPIFFPTTPDILPWHLQNASPAMFKIRFALAATLVGAYGIYNSYEICEGAPVPGKEEFAHSEKYQYKVWDWNRPGNIKGFIKTLNGIRRDNRSLHHLKNLRFHDSDNPAILVYSKTLDENILLFAVNLDPDRKQGATVTLDLPAMGLASENIYGLYDLLSHESYVWSGKYNYVELTPQKEVMHIFKIEKF
ncbi:MAG TPA: maltotransferase domain-containing protein [Fibrobacteria bacterium]|nr:maltotransferase domain-containing protein [Fibrobacteria bacterium]